MDSEKELESYIGAPCGQKEITMIDPPGGWRFGFPKELPDPKPESIVEWLVENGYPQDEITSLGENFFCRYFVKND